MCTPALPKPIPAKVAAIIIFVRASMPPSCTAVRNDSAISCNDRSAHRSDTGFAPQYVTRSSGCLRSKSAYQRAV